MSRVFLDVGAHTGETLSVAVHPRWRFDRIVCFEPAPSCWPALDAVTDSRVQVCRFGLWERDDTVVLHGAGDVGASIATDKRGLAAGAVLCEFRDAAEWFTANLRPDDDVYAKINIEGAEVDLIDRLSTSGTLHLIDHLLIHFDVRKVPSKAHLEARARGQLERAGVQYLVADQIGFGGVYRGTRNWLRWCDAPPATRDLRYRLLPRATHRARVALWPLKVRVTALRSARSAVQ